MYKRSRHARKRLFASVEPVEELSDLGPLVVVAPTTHDGIDLLYQVSSGHRCATACEPTNLLLEVVDRFLSGIGIERSPPGTRLDLACRQVHGPAPSLDLVRGKAISGSSDGFYHLLLGRIGG